MDQQYLLILVLGAIISGAVGAAIGDKKGRQVAGFSWGFLLGPVGWVLVAVGPDLRRKCVACGACPIEGVRLCAKCERSPSPL